MGFFSLLETVNNLVIKNNFTIQKGEAGITHCIGYIEQIPLQITISYDLRIIIFKGQGIDDKKTYSFFE